MNLPTLQELYDAIINDFEQQFGTGSNFVGKLFIRATAAVISAKQYLLYLLINEVLKNIFPDTADSEEHGGTLERFGRVKLGRERREGQAGEYIAEVTGDIGATIPVSTTFKSDDNATNAGFLYILDQAFTFTSTTESISLRSLESGLEAELKSGDTLTSTAPILNVNDAATIQSVTLAPLAPETIEEYRSAVVQAFQLEPQGGAAADYILWANDAAGVVGVYPYASGTTANSINVYIEGNTPTGVPDQSVLDEVSDVIEQDPDVTKPVLERGRRPLGVLQVNSLPVTIGVVDITITGLNDNTVETQNAIEAAVEAQLATVRPFIAAADLLENKNDVLTAGKLVAVVQAAIGSSNYFSGLTWSVGATPIAGSYTFNNGEIPNIGTITYN